jgi:hypothetical protein
MTRSFACSIQPSFTVPSNMTSTNAISSVSKILTTKRIIKTETGNTKFRDANKNRRRRVSTNSRSTTKEAQMKKYKNVMLARNLLAALLARSVPPSFFCLLARFRQVFTCFTVPSNYKNSLIRIQKRRCRRKHKRGNRATQRNRGVGVCIASKIHTHALSLSLFLSFSLREDGGDVLVKTAAQKLQQRGQIVRSKFQKNKSYKLTNTLKSCKKPVTS